MKTTYFLIFFFYVHLSVTGQQKSADSSILHRKFLIALNSSFWFGNIRAGSYPDVINYNQVEATLMPKLGYFITSNLALGLQYRYGKYWSNFGREEPDSKTGGIFIEYYFSNILGRRKALTDSVHKKKLSIYPYLNLSYSRRNFYRGKDSSGQKAAFFNAKNQNALVTPLLGINIQPKRRLSYNIAIGLEFAAKPTIILPNTTYAKIFPINELGVAYFIYKQKKK